MDSEAAAPEAPPTYTESVVGDVKDGPTDSVVYPVVRVVAAAEEVNSDAASLRSALAGSLDAMRDVIDVSLDVGLVVLRQHILESLRVGAPDTAIEQALALLRKTEDDFIDDKTYTPETVRVMNDATTHLYRHGRPSTVARVWAARNMVQPSTVHQDELCRRYYAAILETDLCAEWAAVAQEILDLDASIQPDLRQLARLYLSHCLGSADADLADGVAVNLFKAEGGRDVALYLVRSATAAKDERRRETRVAAALKLFMSLTSAPFDQLYPGGKATMPPLVFGTTSAVASDAIYGGAPQKATLDDLRTVANVVLVGAVDPLRQMDAAHWLVVMGYGVDASDWLTARFKEADVDVVPDRRRRLARYLLFDKTVALGLDADVYAACQRAAYGPSA
jgi:hypothetical protein